MPVAEIPELAQGFSRTVSEGENEYRVAVESTCDYCGMRIFGTIAAVLHQEELMHRLHCAPHIGPLSYHLQ